MSNPFAPPNRADDAADSADALLDVDGVTYRYPSDHGGARAALSDVSLRIGRGEHVALLGHNGSGKSTLVRLLGGLILPTSGSISIAGVDTHLASSRRLVRERIGMIFSDPDNQIVATVVEDDVGWSLAARGLPRAEITARVARALDAVGMAAMRTMPPDQLSGGQRQRLAIAAVLALEPACILADEPTAQLDPLARTEVMSLLRGLRQDRGITLVHATHLLEEVALADRVIVLDGGRVAIDCTPAEAFADLDRLRALRIVISDLAQLGERLRALGMHVPTDALTPEAVLGAMEARA